MAERELTPELAKQLFGPLDLNEEPPIEGLAPKDKPAHEYTDEEWEAQHQHTQRVLREREQAERSEAERTDEERHADVIAELMNPERKRAANLAFIQPFTGPTDRMTVLRACVKCAVDPRRTAIAPSTDRSPGAPAGVGNGWASRAVPGRRSGRRCWPAIEAAAIYAIS